MLVSKQWLEQFVEFPESLPPKAIADKLTMSTVEVEKIITSSNTLDHIVVGHVLSVEQHPNADKLKVCMVDAGTETLQIVCGGSNVVAGMKVALGTIGASVLWHGEGEPVVLAKTAVRGVESFGMICAADEIGLLEQFPKKEEKEIIDLSAIDAPPGTPLANALGLSDVVFDIDNKSMTHRPDLWGHYGMAREVAALFRLPLKAYTPAKIKEGKGSDLMIDVQAPDLCSRYMAVVVSGVSVGPSPAWMQARLRAVGIRPINNVVDITNYVMMDIGQPMHAFDAKKIAKNPALCSVTIRRAKEGEMCVTLDQKTHTLPEDTLVIANADHVLAIAGVMGGNGSDISDDTTTVVFEAATFDAASVRKTSTRLGIRTESSARFEKSLDPELAALGLRRAVELLKEICPTATVASRVADTRTGVEQRSPISISLSFLSSVIGIPLPKETVVDILTRLGFSVKGKKDQFSVTVPSWRATKDIAIPEDIAEEVARIYGYNAVPSALPTVSMQPPVQDPEHRIIETARTVLAMEHGLTEVYNYSFVSPEWLSRIGIDTRHHIELENPIAADRPLLRRRLLSNLFENVESNLHRFDSVRMFEVGHVYRMEEKGECIQAKSEEHLPGQALVVGMVVAEKNNSTPFFDMSSALHTLMRRLRCPYVLQKNTPEVTYVHPSRSATIHVQDMVVGYIGELHPATALKLGIESRVAFCEINMSAIVPFCHLKNPTSYVPLLLYPSVRRDLAFIVPVSVTHEKIHDTLRSADPLITQVELFDVYQGKHVGEGKKSMAYHITYQATDRTLSTEEVDAIQEHITLLLQKEFSATIRG